MFPVADGDTGTNMVLTLRALEEGALATQAGRARGADGVLPALRAMVERRTDPDRPLRVAYAHARRPEAVPELIAMVQAARPLARTEVVCEIGPTVGTHAGPGTLALAFVHDPFDEEQPAGTA